MRSRAFLCCCMHVHTDKNSVCVLSANWIKMSGVWGDENVLIYTTGRFYKCMEIKSIGDSIIAWAFNIWNLERNTFYKKWEERDRKERNKFLLYYSSDVFDFWCSEKFLKSIHYGESGVLPCIYTRRLFLFLQNCGSLRPKFMKKFDFIIGYDIIDS